jgi:hypothetical protein
MKAADHLRHVVAELWVMGLLVAPVIVILATMIGLAFWGTARSACGSVESPLAPLLCWGPSRCASFHNLIPEYPVTAVELDGHVKPARFHDA